MGKKMNVRTRMRFLYDGVRSLEDRVILEVLRQHEQDGIEAIDLREHAEHDADEQLYEYVGTLYMPDVEIYALSCYSDRLIDSVTTTGAEFLYGSDASFAGLSILGQVCAIVGHRPDRYELLVSAFASDYIKGALKAGATEEELKMIMLRDRRLRGVYSCDEAGLEDYGEVKVLRDTEKLLVLQYDMDDQLDEDERGRQLRCLADRVLLPEYASGKQRKILLMHTMRKSFGQDGDKKIVAMGVLSSDRDAMAELLTVAQAHGYASSQENESRYPLGCQTHRYLRGCQMCATSIDAIEGQTKAVRDFTELLTCL